MIVRTTLVPAAWATARRLVRALELQTFQPESAAIVPLVVMWTPKNATVLKAENFHVAYPTVGSVRLLASAKPNTSRFTTGSAATIGLPAARAEAWAVWPEDENPPAWKPKEPPARTRARTVCCIRFRNIGGCCRR